MKKIILLLMTISAVSVNAQSLKDALFGGKLKNDSGSVVRKGDDLSTKIDTTKKKPAEAAKINPVAKDSSTSVVSTQKDASSATGKTLTDNNNVSSNNTTPAGNSTANTVPRDNNKIWKEYMDSLSSTLKTEALPNKKIKSGTYYILVQYAIETDGQVSLSNVSCSPENSFLEQTIKERITLTAPQLNPVLSGYGKAQRASKKYNFTLTKM